MAKYVARYVMRGDEAVVEYSARDDDEGVKLALSACGKVGEMEVEELVVGRVEDGAESPVITSFSSPSYAVAVKVVFRRKYPCVKPRPLSELYKYIDVKAFEEAVNAR